MPRKDPTFSSKDLIRFYEKHLTPKEQSEVRAYFRTLGSGGPMYLERTTARVSKRLLDFVTQQLTTLNPIEQLQNAITELDDLNSEVRKLVKREFIRQTGLKL